MLNWMLEREKCFIQKRIFENQIIYVKIMQKSAVEYIFGGNLSTFKMSTFIPNTDQHNKLLLK